ncbi:MAG: NitT/TauT family transport system permease protein [Myxococcota bacterium]
MRGERLLPVLTAGVLISGWAALSSRYPPVLLPSPIETLQAAITGHATLAEATATTATASLIGLLIAIGVGLLGAMLFSRSKWLEAALYPYALLVQTVPIVAIAPLLVVWLGYGLPPAIASAAIVSFFPVLTAANLGLRATPPEQVELFALYRASFGATLLHLRLPGALPYLFSGLRTAAGLSVIGAIVGEFVGSNGFPPSLGYLVLRSARSADTATSFAAIFAAAALALVFFSAVRLLEKLSIGRWHGGE